MRSSALLATALLAAVNAAPVAEPVKTVYDVVDVFTTVYEVAPAPVPTRAASAVRVVDLRQSRAPVSSSVRTTTTAVVAQPAVVKTSSTVVSPAQASAAPQTSKASAAPQTPSGGGYNAYNGDKYAQRVLDHHNIHRANHSAPSLAWDSNLANIAYQIANSCNYGHDTATGGGGYGQNIAAGADINNITSVITDLFYNSESGNFASLYGQATPSNINDHSKFSAYGHFTQLVWKSTTKVGCASVDCKGRGKGPQGLGNVGTSVTPVFTVCNYGPPGNYLGEFDKNVLKPNGQAPINWSYKY